jgi:hypothetical protein
VECSCGFERRDGTARDTSTRRRDGMGQLDGKVAIVTDSDFVSGQTLVVTGGA